MKTKYLVGLIALVMLVLATAPVMAANTTAAIDVNGTVVQTLSIANNVQVIDFGAFSQGINEKDSVGTLTVTSNFVPNWKVTGTMSDGYGFLRTNPANAPLTKPLEEYNYQTSTWVGAHGFSFTGSASTTMLESFRQNVLITDAPGNYGTTITYTIAAV